MAAVRRDLRDLIAEVLDEQTATPEKMDRLVGQLLEAEKPIWTTVTCKHCHKQGKYEVFFPDLMTRAKALALLLDQSKGKPKETLRQEVTVKVSTVEELEALSDDDLARLAGSR